jgi:4-aminobutyrate aminotransferase-like enzyme
MPTAIHIRLPFKRVVPESGELKSVITKALDEQLRKFTQYTQAYCYNRQSIEYAERLVSVYPGGVPAKVCFGNCGSDGNDAAVKFARAYTGRQKNLRVYGRILRKHLRLLDAHRLFTRMHEKMGPFLPEVYHFPFLRQRRGRFDLRKGAFRKYSGPSKAASRRARSPQ